MNAAEKYAALTAIEQAAKKAKTALASEALADFHAQHADRWRTPYGTVMVKGLNAESLISIADEAAFLAWVGEHYPSEVETTVPAPVVRVRQAFRDVVVRRLTVEQHEFDGAPLDVVVDTGLGEHVEWAKVTPPGKPTVSMAGGKDEAALLARINADRLIEQGLLTLLPAGAQS